MNQTDIFPMTVKGRTFNSFREIEVAFELPEYCVSQRYYRFGKRGDELAKPARKSVTGKNIMATINGETKPVLEWLKFYGISRKLYRNRRHQGGWSVEDAITVPIGAMTGVTYTNARCVNYNGENLRVSEIARKLGLSWTAVKCRIEHGWTPEQICTELGNQRRKIASNRRRGTLGRNARAALSLGLHHARVTHRINKLGWSEEQAMSLPAHSKAPSVEKNRKNELALLGIII